jgi:hypothetical protein
VELDVLTAVCPFMTTTAQSENEPARWNERAEDARRTADQTVDPVEKQLLLEIADAYEQLAALAAAKLPAKE